MIPYLAIFSLFALGALLSTRGRNKFFWAAAAPMIILIGTRFEVGPDWESYLEIFTYYRYLSFDDAILLRGDPGFGILLWLVQYLDGEIWLVNLVCGAIFCFGLFAFSARQRNPWLAIVAAIPVLLIIVALSATRQATAVGFIFLAIRSFLDRKTASVVIYIALAALFHASAIVFVPLFAMSYAKSPVQATILFVIGGVLLWFFLWQQIDTYASRYTGEDVASQGALLRLSMNAIPAVFIIFLGRKIFPDTGHRIFWRNMSLVAIALVPLFWVVPSSTALDRLGQYFAVLQVVGFSQLPTALTASRQKQSLITFAIIGYHLAILAVFLVFSFHAQYWVPYQSYLFD